MRLRPFAWSDYPAIAALSQAIYPDYPSSTREWVLNDAIRPATCLHRRWVCEHDDMIVGFAEYDQAPLMHHPGVFLVQVLVHPAVQRRGIGSGLWATVVEGLREHQPKNAYATIRENLLGGNRFALRKGFIERLRTDEMTLDLAQFDPEPYRGSTEHLAASGVRICSLASLGDEPGWGRQLHALEMAVWPEIPMVERPTPLSYEQYRIEKLEHPNFLFDGSFVALHRGEFVGFTTLWTSELAPSCLVTDVTGVLPGYRRRGIALGLRLAGIQYARGAGAISLTTYTEPTNRPIVCLAQRLGYSKQPQWLTYELRDFRSTREHSLAPARRPGHG